MVTRAIVTLFASTALVALGAGCATQRSNDAVARLTESDAARPAVGQEFVGTWRGRFDPISDGGGGGASTGVMTLEIKDDATYRLTSTGVGRADAAGTVSIDTGVVRANGRSITLHSSAGQSIPLTRNGKALGTVTKRGGFTISLTLEKEPPQAP